MNCLSANKWIITETGDRVSRCASMVTLLETKLHDDDETPDYIRQSAAPLLHAIIDNLHSVSDNVAALLDLINEADKIESPNGTTYFEFSAQKQKKPIVEETDVEYSTEVLF